MRIFCVLLWMSLGLGVVKAEQVYDAQRLLSAFLEGQYCQRIIEHGLSVTLSE